MLAPNGPVLAPDLSLNPTVMTGTTTQIQWTTSQPAFSQVFLSSAFDIYGQYHFFTHSHSVPAIRCS
jgi:hypothetical protein